MLPWTLYKGYYREHAYAMSNQTLHAFQVEWLIVFALTLVLVPLVIEGI
jgi:hypothetical protein